VDSSIKIKDIIGLDRPPLLDNGLQVCLSYHTHQGCWTTCRRANTHAHKLMDAERSRVQSFLRAQLQKIHPTGAVTSTTSLG